MGDIHVSDVSPMSTTVFICAVAVLRFGWFVRSSPEPPPPLPDSHCATAKCHRECHHHPTIVLGFIYLLTYMFPKKGSKNKNKNKNKNKSFCSYQSFEQYPLLQPPNSGPLRKHQKSPPFLCISDVHHVRKIDPRVGAGYARHTYIDNRHISTYIICVRPLTGILYEVDTR